MDKLVFMETDSWKGKVLLKEDGFFEGIVFNEDSEVTTDLINGSYSANNGTIRFRTTKSKHTYELRDGDFCNYHNLDSSGLFEGTCTDLFGRINYVTLSVDLYNIENEEISSEIDDLKLFINRTKAEIYSKIPVLRRIK